MSLTRRVAGRYAMVKRRASGRRGGERVLRRRFRELSGHELDLENARTLTEKLFRRMIVIDRSGDESLTPLVDKLAVRHWVAEKIGAEHAVPVLWTGTSPSDIPFDELPLPSVLKANHNSGAVAVISEGVDRDLVRRNARGWLRESHYWAGREYQYHPIERKLFVEQFLDDGFEDGPLDYRFWCFHGAVELVQLDNHSHSINAFFDTEWSPLNLATRAGHPRFSIARPAELDHMLSLARELSAGFDFVRVDLYNIHGQVKFGELTFTPGAARIRFQPPEWDRVLGDKW